MLAITPPTYKMRDYFWFHKEPHRMLLTGTGGSINSKTAHISRASAQGGSRTHKTTALNRVYIPFYYSGIILPFGSIYLQDHSLGLLQAQHIPLAKYYQIQC